LHALGAVTGLLGIVIALYGPSIWRVWLAHCYLA
jgi:hypothetical protein